jgi:hypothetical protein
VVDEVEDEVSGNVAPKNDFPPADRVMSREALVAQTGGEPAHQAGDAAAPSRRKKRRRRRSKGERPAGEAPFAQRDAQPVLPESGAGAPNVRHDEAWEAFAVRAVPPLAVERTTEAAAPAPAEAPVPQAAGEADREASAPREEPAVKKAPRKATPKKATVPKEKPAKAAPKKAAVKKAAAKKAPPAEPADA